ncbi:MULTISPECIES: response regulator [Spirosoma]|uniref:Response regulator n=1 Tax=Spirosoma sordidisoli TaxID=2502893 RepID=A0A4Q2URP2_9BACT|nr:MULTISPECIES: response regulator [Spirosoma]RYC69499.1 response regulator [Spirosoma sordidisoli]
MPHRNKDCVFIVDDDEDDLFIIQQVFSQYSPECQLKPLTSGMALLDALAEAPALPNLILLDLNMPQMSGLETLAHLRQHKTYATIPVVVLTTSDHARDKQQAAQLKASGFITKPSTIEQYNKVVLKLRQDWLLGNCVPDQPAGCC